MIRFEDVSFAYATAAGPVPALESVSFAVEPGETIAVVGANGSGKSTLARLSNGLLLPTAGRVEVDGYDTREASSIWEVRRRVGIVFQNPDNQIVGTLVEEDVAFGPENLGVEPSEIGERVTESLRSVGLEGFERREPHLLSGGQKQRLALAGALAMRPHYLVLDEPTSMLDPQGREDVLAALDALESPAPGVIHVTHDLTDVVRSDRVLVLARGRSVFHGSPDELLSASSRLADWGLGLPPLGALGDELRARGLAVPPSALTPESVVSALCRSV